MVAGTDSRLTASRAAACLVVFMFAFNAISQVGAQGEEESGTAPNLCETLGEFITVPEDPTGLCSDEPGAIDLCSLLASLDMPGELLSIPGLCGEPLPSTDHCDYLEVEGDVAVPGACGEPLPSSDYCDYIYGDVTVPGACGEPLPSTDYCTYLDGSSMYPIPGLCGEPLPDDDPCSHPEFTALDLPGICGEPLPSTNPCDAAPTFCPLLMVLILALDDMESDAIDGVVAADALVESSVRHEDETKSLIGFMDGSTPAPDDSSGARAPGSGQWSLEVTTDPGEATGSGVGATDVGAVGSGYKLFELPFENTGNVSQPATLYLDPWREEQDTMRPPEQWEKQQAADACKTAKRNAKIAAGVWVITAFGGPGPAWYAAGIVTVGMVADAAEKCAESTAIINDKGFMHCTSDSYVDWGPGASSEGQRAVAEVLTLESTASFDDDPPREWFRVDISRAGYWAGVDACNSETQAQHEAAQARSTQHKESEGSGSANLHMDLLALPGVVPTITENAKTVNPELEAYIDTGAGLLIIGCQNAACPLDVSININSGCGTGLLMPTGEGVEFAYEDGECVTLTLIVHGYEFGASVPLLLKMHMDQQGPRSG